MYKQSKASYQSMADTLIQISSKYGHGRNKETGNIVKIQDFIGMFDIHDDNHHINYVKVHQSPIGCKVIYINGHSKPIYIQEGDEIKDGIGAGIWLSSIVLSCWLLQNKDIVNGKRVLELGCGIGLCGMSVAVNSCPRALTLTDCDKALFNVLKKNVEYNAKNIKTIPSIKYFDWNYSNTQDKYDVILAADCLYHNTKDILLNAILSSLTIGGKLVLTNPPEWSRPGFDEFIYGLKEHGEVTIKQLRLTMNKQYTKEIWLLLFTRTS